ncbi:MAG TPA: TIGR03118 family protein [Candidatus Saccharimonadales bacterium]|jgi:uncharacterized protein (TIGR03118 family)|nr:TIGR03118 family protein [Candidatus Saccharimonadales bacterium]
MKLAIKITALFALAFLFPSFGFAQYTRTDLVTNLGTGGTVEDPHLVNAWGLVSTATSPFWVSDNATGLSTLYTINNTSTGIKATVNGLVVSVTSATGGAGMPTGIVAPETPTGGTDFTVTAVNPNTHLQASAPAAFIFAALDGTITGWNPTVNPTVAILTPANRSSAGATYTGLAIATINGHKFLYAADDGANRRIDVFDSNFQLVTYFGPDAFVDPRIPRKFAPYGIQTATAKDGTQTVWVTYTALDKAQGGFVSAFTPEGQLMRHIDLDGPLHSPWGVAIAPPDFGPLSNALLITNNTPTGRINAFDPKTGAFLGALRDTAGKAIEIDNVWAIQFGQSGPAGSNGNTNQLFFTAGNNNYGSGTFGVITVGQ